jgi:HK97 family phage major capsid protein/HK97 family phage prohead protease
MRKEVLIMKIKKKKTKTTETIRKIKGRALKRSFTIDRAAIDQEARTVELSFSSEEPVEQFFGIEILDHKKGSIRLDRLESGSANLLMDHDHRDVVGVIESVSIDSVSGKGTATARFGKSERANEIWQDVTDGIRSSVSVGYRIHKMILEEAGKDSPDVFRIIDWRPLEISLVSVPADATVGVGRSEEMDKEREIIIITKTEDETVKKCLQCGRDHETMDASGICPDCVTRNLARAAVEPTVPAPAAVATGVPVVSDADRSAIENKIRHDEGERVSIIRQMGEIYHCEDLASEHVRDGKTVKEFSDAALEHSKKSAPLRMQEIGLTDKEAERFSIVRAVRDLSDSMMNKKPVENTLEMEASEAVAKQLGRRSRGFFVPPEVVKASRDLNVGTGTAGGNLVATELLDGSFIELLRNAMMVRRMGASVLTGLQGDIAIPRHTGAASGEWVAESGSASESAQTFNQVSMSPKTVTGFVDMSRKLIIQSSIGIENFVRMDLALVIALAIDLASINGSGAGNQPTGILNTSGIGDVAMGTDGGPMTWPLFLQLWAEVANDNAAFGSTGFLTNTKAHAHLMGIAKAANTAKFIAENFPGMDGMTEYAGAPGGVSNQVPSNLTKGGSGAVASAMIYGNWRDLIIAEWSGLDVLVDPFTGATAGTVRTIVHQDVDVAVRHPESFSASQDILTT